ncbi:hypothetical protein F0562_016618 [Nyssa sinensis]|uniref:Uncharacterized protein n=1 Tax=Nyssa sinensis TaxID=561372 RepID=A0A5J4ZCG8_9ASTE|nr:hypothetical protein F0562_016618 [Nyssa sinensis]
MLQAQKAHLTDYSDERSAYLTQLTEEVHAEFDQIGKYALKGLDEAAARIMENIERQMQAFEESTELNKLQIEKNQKKAAEFEGQNADWNEGLFFKKTRTRGRSRLVKKQKAQAEMEEIKELTKEILDRKQGETFTLMLIGLLVDAISSSSSHCIN